MSQILRLKTCVSMPYAFCMNTSPSAAIRVHCRTVRCGLLVLLERLADVAPGEANA